MSSPEMCPVHRPLLQLALLKLFLEDGLGRSRDKANLKVEKLWKGASTDFLS